MYADGLPGARVTVSVAGEEAVEYETENEPLKATTFIEAIPGASFAIALELGEEFAYRDARDSIEFKVKLDGQSVRSKVTSALKHRSSKVDGTINKVDGVNMLRTFEFAEHETTETVDRNVNSQKYANVGEIRVELRRCRKTGKSKSLVSRKFNGIGEDALPEKAAKGRSISSHTRLGPGEVVGDRYNVDVTYPYGTAPIATYVFQYRTRRDLQIEGIIERSPSPVPLEERDPDELTPDELRELVRRSRADKAAAVNVKQEPKREKRARKRSDSSDNEGADGDVTIISQTNKRKRTRESMASAEVIDLSDD